MPRIIDEEVQREFLALINAIKTDQARVYACLDRKTGDNVPVVCYVGPSQKDKTKTAVVPLAMLFGTDPPNVRLQLLRQQGEADN